jgi:hypothetical protein
MHTPLSIRTSHATPPAQTTVPNAIRRAADNQFISPTTRHKQTIHNFLDYVKGCRQDGIDSKLAPLLNSTTHELLMLQRDGDGNMRTYPQGGGTGILYKAMKYSKGGTSKTLLNGAAKRVRDFNDEENINRTEEVR